MTIKDIQILAQEHGLTIGEHISISEMGIDFTVAFVQDIANQQWVLRIPRRQGMTEQIDKEKRILELAKKYLSVNVPDWKIASERMIAYPLLADSPALTFDGNTHEVTWHIDKHSLAYVQSLAKTLVDLHSIKVKDVEKSQLKIMNPSDLRPEIAHRLQLIKSEMGISETLETRYNKWLDNDALWPNFTRFVHGDLYAGHVLTTKDGLVSGIIDWSTAHMSDPAIDFSGHASVFGEESLKLLITEYMNQGGLVWDKLYEQSLERAAAAPLAYGFFAIETEDENHIAAAKALLGVSK